MSFNDYSKIERNNSHKDAKLSNDPVNDQIAVEVRLVGIFRNYFTNNSFIVELDKNADMYNLIEHIESLSGEINNQGQKKSFKELVFQGVKEPNKKSDRVENEEWVGNEESEKNNIQLNPWIRILLNGRDIAFLSREETILNNEDVVIFMSALAGG